MPPELFLNGKLNKIDCLVFCIIEFYDGVDHCFASNDHIAKILNVTPTTVSTSISRLKEEGYIKQLSFDGRKRVLSINPDYKKTNNLILKDLNSRFKENLKYNNKEIIKNNLRASSKEEAGQTKVRNSTAVNDSSSINNQTIIRRRTTQQTLPEKKTDWSKLYPTNKRKEVPPLHATEDVEDILSYWNDHYKLPLPKIGTKSYNNCIKLTKTQLKKHTPDKIKEVISNFYIAATDTRYEPAKPDMKFKYQKMTLDRFIYQGFPTPYSLFDKYLEPPKMIGTPVEDLYPNITNKLISLYREEVLGKARTALSTKDINCFRRAAVMLKEFIKNNEDKFSPYMSVDDYKMARYLFECIVKSTNDESKILPHWFCAEHNINKTLPAYMYRQGILEEESRHHSPMSRFNSDGDVTFDLYD
jgi:DNA-binding transcriptional ArsR family regulator